MSLPSGYSAVPIGAAPALGGNESATFAVYLPGHGRDRPVLYSEAGAELAKPDFERLSEHGVRTLYVRTQDLSQCEQILESRLAVVLQSSELAPAEKASLVLHVGTSVARDICQPTEPALDLRRVTSVVDNVIACVLSDPLIAANMLQMAEHERTTASHMFMVSALATMLGAEIFGGDRQKLQALGFAGMMHDVGKLAIRPEVINKPGPLSPAEVSLIQQHPIESVRLLGDHPDATSEVRRIILQHHERIDGRGYPVGVGGSDLLLGSRILSIVDAFHAMIGRRSYRKPFTAPEANRAMRTQAGRQFDRDLLSCWRDLFERYWQNGAATGREPAVAPDEFSSRHEHRPKGPPRRMFGHRAKRFVCNGNVTVACVYAGRLSNVTLAPDEFVAPVHDISRGGVCIYSAHPLFRGEVVHVRLSDNKRKFWVRGSVAWCRQHDANLYRAGIQFEQRIADIQARRRAQVKPMSALDPLIQGRPYVPVEAGRRAVEADGVGALKREQALDTLSSIGTMRRIHVAEERTVLALSTSGDASVRLAATDVLMKIGSKAARSALLGMLDDADREVRARAAIAAGALRMAEASIELARLLDDEDRKVALRAAAALGRIGDHSGLSLVAAVVAHGGPDARLAAHVLGEIVGHRFAANAEGVKSAQRYLAVKELAAS
jgi:HD-GYP domain-containing protein (c-di-GMP phosphodiesterase class II)